MHDNFYTPGNDDAIRKESKVNIVDFYNILRQRCSANPEDAPLKGVEDVPRKAEMHDVIS